MKRKRILIKILLTILAVVTALVAAAASLIMIVWAPAGKGENPFFLPGDTQFLWEAGDRWSLGFARQNLTDSPEVRENIAKGVYVLPGYNDVGTTYRSTGIMDDLFARAVYLDDNTGRGGILYAVVDCFGLTNTDVNEIRSLIWDWARDRGIRSIQVAATHTHAGIDTIGSGNVLFGGKVPAFQRLLIEKIAQALQEAYDNRMDGRLFLATADSGDLFADLRAPRVFEPLITRLRFAPAQPGASEVWLLSAGVHPEASGRGNTVVTADFPAWAAAYIMEKTGAETMFIQGALGALITLDGWASRTDYGLEAVKTSGREFAQYVLGEHENSSLSAETELPALLNFVSAEYELPLENFIYILGRNVGNTNHAAYNVRGRGYRCATTDEVSYLRLGDRDDSIDILIQSGELAPEVAMGGFLGGEESALGTEYPRKAIFEILREHPFASQRQIVFGMANNFTGYVLADNDFVTDRWLPWLSWGVDRFGIPHYEETVSTSPQAAGLLTEAFCGLFAEIRDRQPTQGGNGFNTGRWLEEDAHAMQFQYIAIFFDGEDYFAADAADRQWILDQLEHVTFAPVETINAVKNDFAFAMNEPYLFFEFTDDGRLWAKVPPESGRDYLYYEAKAAEHPQLAALRARIGESIETVQ